MEKIATRKDWDNTPMPEKHTVFQLERTFTPEQMAVLRKGNIPQEMEDKWFWFYEDGRLYAHRSWTGICIYVIEFNQETGIHNVTVNRDPEQYRCTDIEHDRSTLNMLLDWWAQPEYDYYGEWITETLNTLQQNK